MSAPARAMRCTRARSRTARASKLVESAGMSIELAREGEIADVGRRDAEVGVAVLQGVDGLNRAIGALEQLEFDAGLVLRVGPRERIADGAVGGAAAAQADGEADDASRRRFGRANAISAGRDQNRHRDSLPPLFHHCTSTSWLTDRRDETGESMRRDYMPIGAGLRATPRPGSPVWTVAASVGAREGLGFGDFEPGQTKATADAALSEGQGCGSAQPSRDGDPAGASSPGRAL